MTLLPVADGARLLGIHAKTLHHWLKEANLPLAPHPTDARVKCVTQEHLQQVARLHERRLQASGPLDAAHPPLGPSQMSVPSVPENQRETASTACSFLTSSGSESDLIQKLCGLETKIATLQEQVAQLTLALLQERERSLEHRLMTLESLMPAFMGRQMSNLPVAQPRQEPLGVRQPSQELHPAEHLARSRRPPLIEYCTAGIYVIISSQEGELHLEPNSRAWFDWLATLSSFRFIGPVGRFTAHRGYKQGQQTLYWSASRCVRRHTYKHYLGMTESLTLASLEHTAARLQSDVDAR
jgi:DNA-binding transcriptional MerR regulator